MDDLIGSLARYHLSALQDCVNKIFKIKFSFILLQVGGEVYIIWAYGVNDIEDNGNFVQHSAMARGWSQDKIVIVGEAPIPTKAAASLLHSRINAIVAFTIALLALIM